MAKRGIVRHFQLTWSAAGNMTISAIVRHGNKNSYFYEAMSKAPDGVIEDIIAHIESKVTK